MDWQIKCEYQGFGGFKTENLNVSQEPSKNKSKFFYDYEKHVPIGLQTNGLQNRR